MSCSIAAGRCRSAATSAGFLSSLLSRSASLPAAVVLPEPCRPARRMVVGGRGEKARRESEEPRSSVSSSCTIFTTCCPGVRLFRTSSPSARSRTCATNSLTTPKLTSASSRARRTSRMAREIASSSRTPRPRRSPRAPWSFSLSVSNIADRRVAGLETAQSGSQTARMVSAAAARRTVSVLFCDLADSTALGERVDPEPLRELMGRWYDEMRIAVERHGGTVEKFVGDAVMAVFGLPRAHEDDALRAVRAALEMQTAVERLNASLARRDAAELRIRIGINTGEVVTGDEAATLATGDAVNTAKRLEQGAAGGEILIGGLTERLVPHAARLEPVAPLDAKGKSAPVEAWRVLGAVAGADSFARRWDTPLVGRTSELAVLRAELTASSDERRCRLVTLIGAAGVGKTRLVSELVAEVRDHATVAAGRCLPYGDGITFWPLTELIRHLGGERAVSDAMGDEPDAALVVERLRVLGGEGTAPPEELFWAVRRLFECLAASRPLLVVLEDVHWAEPTMLDLVEHVSRWSRDAPILILCVAREERLEGGPEWEGGGVRLEPLSSGEATQLLEALDDDGILSPELRTRVAEVAQGNPLY